MDTALWPHPQEIVAKPMEENISTTNPTTTTTPNNTIKPQPSTSLERKVRPQKDQAVNCPRCNSTNTKFCYYNNYSLTQPRYFCKGCRRYWTEGGSLRNIPVGGGSRKNKRPSSSISSSSATSKIRLSETNHHHQNHHQQQINHGLPTNPNHHKIHIEGQDLNLGFPSTLSEFMHLPNIENPTNQHHHFLQKSSTNHMNQPPNASNTSHLSALELLTGFSSSSRGLMSTSPFMPMQIHEQNPNPNPNSGFLTGFNLQTEFKPTLNFSLDGPYGVQENGGRILFPFEDLKSTTTNATTTTAIATTTTTPDHDHHHQEQQHQHGDSTGYWTGMLGGTGSW